MSNQVKTAINAIRDFISGRAVEAKVPNAADEESRQAVAAELVAAMSGRPPETRDETSNEAGEEAAPTDQDIQIEKEQDRSRQLFMEHGYFDEAVQDLRIGKSAANRAAAARALGLVGSQRATPHLIAAMFDDDDEVRTAAGEALNQIGDPNVPLTPRQEKAQQSEPAEAAPADLETGEAEEFSDPEPTEDINVELLQAADSPDEEWLNNQSVTNEEPIADEASSAFVDDAIAATEEQRLLLEEHGVRETAEQYERQVVASATLRVKAENEARWRSERESKIRSEAEARRIEEEEERQRAEEEAKLRRAAEQEALASEHTARLKAEAEVHRLGEEEIRLRLENSRLRQAAEELARKRRQIETSRREATEAARHAEATRLRLEAEKRHQDEIARLQNEEQALNFAVEEVTKRRSELELSRQNTQNEIASITQEIDQLLVDAESQVKQLQDARQELMSAEAARRADAERFVQEAEDRKRSEEQQLQQQLETLSNLTRDISIQRLEIEASRKKAEQEAEELTQALARMQAAEEAREQAEKERLRVEAATNEKVELEQRLLDEARKRALDEQARLDEEKRKHDESEEQRMAALAAMHQKTEMEARQRAEKEKQLRMEIDHMRIADAEVRRRIEEAETLRRASAQAYKAAAEKVQRIEAEAHAAAQQEEQILTRLESVRRNVAAETQARAEQEKRVKEEIEQLRRLQDEERPRLEAALLQRTAAAARLQQMRESAADVPAAGDEHRAVVGTSFGNGMPGVTHRDYHASEPAPLRLVSDANSRDAVQTEPGELAASEAGVNVAPAVDSYLNSVDPFKRAAAVTELARSHAADAFALISASFDDPSPQVRNAAARALCQLEPARTVDFFNRALDEGSEERRRSIGAAIADSRLANEAIDKLASDSREDTYNALSILFVMAKTGELKPLVAAIEEHSNDEVAQAVVKLLTLSGQAQRAESAMKKRQGE